MCLTTFNNETKKILKCQENAVQVFDMHLHAREKTKVINLKEVKSERFVFTRASCPPPPDHVLTAARRPRASRTARAMPSRPHFLLPVNPPVTPSAAAQPCNWESPLSSG